MNSKERALRAIYMEEPDMVPWFDGVDPRVLMKIFGKDVRFDKGEILSEQMEISTSVWEKIVKAEAKLGIDFVFVSAIFDPAYNIKLDEKHYVNEWGRIHTTQLCGDISDGYIGGYLDTPEKWDAFNFAPPVTEWRMEVFSKAKKLADKYSLCLVAACGSIMEVGMEAVGIPQFLKYAYTNPEFVKKVIRHCAKYTLELGLAYADAGADVLMIYDDYAYHSGPFLSPKLWREYVLPWNKTVISAFHKKGLPVILHACGDIRPLMDGIIESGYDAVQPLEATANLNLKEVKERWGNSICLIGNIDINTLSLGTEEDVEKEVKMAIKSAASGGGYMLGSSHGIYHSCKPENVVRMSEVRRKYGKYKP